MRTRSGIYVPDMATFDGIPNSSEVVGACVSAASASASLASAMANETYKVDTVRGRFRTYARVTGQEPGTGGYWRGRKTQALWHSRPTYGGNR